jgi:hypothetical protein
MSLIISKFHRHHLCLAQPIIKQKHKELKTFAVILCVQTTKIGTFSESSWISGGFLFASVIWNGYFASVIHFKKAATDLQRTVKEQKLR